MRYPVPAYWRIKVIDVHDGDSLWTQTDRGDRDQSAWLIRLKGVFAPELGQPGGPECRAFVVAWLADHHDGTDWPFLLETFRTPRSDVDVRTLSRRVGVLTSEQGVSLNPAVQTFVTANGYSGGVGS